MKVKQIMQAMQFIVFKLYIASIDFVRVLFQYNVLFVRYSVYKLCYKSLKHNKATLAYALSPLKLF